MATKLESQFEMVRIKLQPMQDRKIYWDRENNIDFKCTPQIKMIRKDALKLQMWKRVGGASSLGNSMLHTWGADMHLRR